MIETDNKDTVGGVSAHGLEPRYQFRNLATVNRAHSSPAPMRMQVNMKDALSPRAPVIRSLHRPSNCFWANPCTDSRIVKIFLIRYRMIPVEQHQFTLARKGTHSVHCKTDPIGRERMRPNEILNNRNMHGTGEPDFDLHFEVVKPVRWLTSICASVGKTRVCFQENANQFFSQIRALLTFQFRPKGDLIATEK